MKSASRATVILKNSSMRHPGWRLIAKFDNLGKGASGAAVQNLMLMLGR